MYRSILLICVFSIISNTDTARILAVFPTPSISHQVVFRVLTQELIKRGHEVVVITTDPAFPKGQAPANLTEIDVHDISYSFLRKSFSVKVLPYELGNELQALSFLKKVETLLGVVGVQITSDPVKKLISDKSHFDLIFIEAFMRPAIVFSYIFDAPVIQVSSFGATLKNLETVGASTHFTLYPLPFRQRLYNLSVWDKMREYYYHIQLMLNKKRYDRVYDEMLQGIFGPNTPSINELTKNVDMLFLNVHPMWMNNQPMPPNVIFMGGLHQKPHEDLPQDLKLFLDSSKNGVVYVSFGSNFRPNMFPTERLKVIIEALSELPYDVLLKWNDGELPGQPKNIKTSKWLPQSDLLRHPNVKAFVMQGGLQSTDEAITAGVPLVCIPLGFDQWYNAEKYVYFKIGLKLDFITLSKLQLKNAIEHVIVNKSYRENVVKLREQMNDQPQTPLERAIWWTEYVIRHGGARHLHSPAANMSWAEYYELELVSLVVTCLFISLLIVTITVISLLRCILKYFRNEYVKVKTS